MIPRYLQLLLAPVFITALMAMFAFGVGLLVVAAPIWMPFMMWLQGEMPFTGVVLWFALPGFGLWLAVTDQIDNDLITPMLCITLVFYSSFIVIPFMWYADWAAVRWY